VAIYLTIREEGTENAFGGVFAPVDSVRADAPQWGAGDDPLDSMLTGQSLPPTAQADYGPMLDRLRTSVDDAMERSVERSSRY
jgi:hypothetical protein